jgi:thiosulfate/3-mercaptopyruvate sulfurtransferase
MFQFLVFILKRQEMKKIQIALAAVLMTVAGFIQAAGLPGPIVSADWLANNLTSVQVLEVTGLVKTFTQAPEFEVDKKTGKKVLVDIGGHIEGSHLLNSKDVRVERLLDGDKTKFLIPEQADFQKLIQSVGINSGKPIVIVPIGQDMADVDEGLRAFWQFKVYGEQNIAVLDGGLTGWLAEGRPFSTAAALTNVGNWVAQAANQEMIATTAEVAEASKSGNIQLIDSRQPSQYWGTSKSPAVTTFGHIAGAKIFSPELMSRSANGAVYFLKPATYAAIMEANGIKPNEPAISYCNTGHLASGSWFILSQIMGNKSAQLYDGSAYLWTKQGNKLEGVPMN